VSFALRTRGCLLHHVPDSLVVLIDHQLRRAIAEKRLIEFTYQSMWRLAEPHDYGIQHGAVRLLVYQVRSRPFQRGWRMLDVAKIEELKVLDRQFGGTRREGHTHHFHWDTIFARVDEPSPA
jgi:hypothetical protein